MEKTLIAQISDNFLNQNNYEFRFHQYIDLEAIKHASLLGQVEKTITTDRFKVLRLRLGFNKFQAIIDALVMELKNHYDSKLDIVSSPEDKANYILNENEKLNTLTITLYNISLAYPESSDLSKSTLDFSEILSEWKIPENDISDGAVPSVLDFAKFILSKSDTEIFNHLNSSQALDIPIESILYENLLFSILKVNSVSKHLVANYAHFFDDTYSVISSDIITTISKHLKETEDQIDSKPAYPFPRIFRDAQSYKFFLSLKEDVDERIELVEFSFIYRQMQKDGFILQQAKNTEFKNLLSSEFEIEISKIKSLTDCYSYKRQKNYSLKKESLKLI